MKPLTILTLLAVLGASAGGLEAAPKSTKPVSKVAKGQFPAQVSPNDALLKFIGPFANQSASKDEFETTAAYEQRVSNFNGRAFTVEVPTTRDFLSRFDALSYDADAGQLTVSLVGNSTIRASRVINPLSREGKKISPSALLIDEYAKFYLKKTEPRTVRVYEAGNAFGAKAQVEEIGSDEVSVGISNLPAGFQALPLQQKISVPAATAQQLKARAKWRLTIETVVVPGQSNFILDDGNYNAPTISSPTEIVTTGKTIMAMLQRAELFDPATGAVYATFVPVQAQSSLSSMTNAAFSNPMPKPGRFGVYLSAAAVAAINAPDQGVAVVLVAEATPASDAGILKGDILLALGSHQLNSAADLQNAIAAMTPGSKALVHVRRGSQLLDLQAQF